MFFRPRYELKYLVTASVAHAIAGRLTGRCHQDANGQEGSYINESLYFDSPRFDFYYHKRDGVKLRRKVRIRRYGDAGPWDRVFVEVKRRNGQYIEKGRFPVRGQLVPSLFNPSHRNDISGTLAPAALQVYNEVLSLSQVYQLRPAIFIRYRRRAFWAEGDERLRITFDSDLCYDLVTRDCAYPLENTRFIFDADLMVMEIKANGRVPFWVLHLIQEFECTMTRFSKYCLGLEHAQGTAGSGVSHLL